MTVDAWKESDTKLLYKSYKIQETDLRVKTANFVSNQYLDLTNGQWAVLITSPYHENFAGLILTVDYDEDQRLYTYKCQDWSRKLQGKYEAVFNGDTTTYNVLRNLITNGGTRTPNPTEADLKACAEILSGLRPADKYKDNDWGGATNINPMTQKQKMIIRNTSRIETIRSLLAGSNIDIFYNECGVLQIEPYNIKDKVNTGLHLEHSETTNRRFTFDLTNLITGVYVDSTEKANSGTLYENSVLVDFFGRFTGEVSNPNTVTIKSDSSSSNNNNNNNNSNNNGNPYGNKAKKIWINSDNGSCGFKNEIANLLRNNGWEVKNAGCCSNCHYEDYWNVSSDYQVYATLYNGFCAGTVREAYSSRIQNALRNKGVVLVIMWDTRDWTNPHGMGPYRYGDFSGYNAGRAWDDNFSSSDPSIKNVKDWLKKNDAKYCCGPTADDVVKQFLAGGYFAYANK